MLRFNENDAPSPLKSRADHTDRP